jgi:hypothetical protein
VTAELFQRFPVHERIMQSHGPRCRAAMPSFFYFFLGDRKSLLGHASQVGPDLGDRDPEEFIDFVSG